MAEKDERPSDDWGNWMARWTFIWTVVLAALYIGTVFVFILR